MPPTLLPHTTSNLEMMPLAYSTRSPCQHAARRRKPDAMHAPAHVDPVSSALKGCAVMSEPSDESSAVTDVASASDATTAIPVAASTPSRTRTSTISSGRAAARSHAALASPLQVPCVRASPFACVTRSPRTIPPAAHASICCGRDVASRSPRSLVSAASKCTAFCAYAPATPADASLSRVYCLGTFLTSCSAGPGSRPNCSWRRLRG
ncbi:hypothetical protein B0T26DRAFT_332842 [Lasiosphaeria miniovina]|uniref:Uncharacterized protein n=1 Tax=Lasiosphaeria miniovina TaxID=1954250 RepID=A0AA40AMH9_9PEZI|nr:uncharacterized protein B0T26DRAFT_332842 [Lasiosphaeria miniovina]KAK0718539.1 hypothetical protein B0T26DRAFT_332842 [Lasiosphaeria miniovina]